MADPRDAVNLGVLKRNDPSLTRMLLTAQHAVLYMGHDDETAGPDDPKVKWDKADAEGALFVVERSVEPRWQIIILNRRSTTNYVEDITADFMSPQEEDNFILYKKASDDVTYCLWFFKKEDCERTCALLKDLLAQLGAERDVRPGEPAQPAAQAEGEVGGSVAAFFQAFQAASLGDAPAGGAAANGTAGPSVAPTAASGGPVILPDRELVRQALALTVQDDRLIDIFEEHYTRLALAGASAAPLPAPAAPSAPPVPPQPAAPLPAARPGGGVEPADPKDGDALLKNLMMARHAKG